MTTLSKAQLNQILSALDGQPRNPNTKDAALKAIGRHGERLGLSLDNILAASRPLRAGVGVAGLIVERAQDLVELGFGEGGHGGILFWL